MTEATSPKPKLQLIADHEVDPATLVLRGGQELRGWREEQRVAVPGAEFTPRFKNRRWDGTHRTGRLLTRGDQLELRCSRGLLYRLRKSFDVPDPPGLWSEAEHASSLSSILSTGSNGRKLRDYQEEAILRSLQAGWGRVALATNAGKGAVIALLAKTLARARRARTLILADEVAVFQALGEEITAWWPEGRLGLVESGAKTPPYEAEVTVAMVPTLSRRLANHPDVWESWIEDHAVLLLDEADKATAATWGRVLQAARFSQWRIGFSGTFPELEARPDPYAVLTLEERVGPVLITARNMELVQRGVSAKPLVELRSYDTKPAIDDPAIKPHWKTWRDMPAPERRAWIYEYGIVYNDDRHRYVASLIQPDTPTVVVVNRIAHGEALEQWIPGAVFLSGTDSKKQRDSATEDLRTGSIPVLIVTKIYDRGTNRLGHASDIIFASGEGSSRQTLQRIGRGLRRAGGKEFLRLVDIVDRGHRYLHTAARRRVSLYAQEGFEVKVDER